MISALIALALAQAGASATCPEHLCDAERLRPYFEKLASIRRDRRAVRILQMGDSHTAGDQITGAWRTALQARYGSAGRGVLAPGRPYPGYLTRGITAAQSPGWTVDGLFGSTWRGEGGPPRGVAGFSLTASSPGASLSLVADPGEEFDRFTICAVHAPGAGGLTLSAGASTAFVSLATDPAGPACETLTVDGLTPAASLVTDGTGPVTITSWSTERSQGGGVVVSNLGTVGIQLLHLARADDRALRAELREYRPDLLVLAYGTNEAFSPNFTAGGFEATIREQVSRLKRGAPGVPILMLGAPDSGTKRPELKGSSAPSCGFFAPPPAPLANPGEIVQSLPPGDGGASAAWGPTGNLSTVQFVERRMAHELGLAFWDWSAAMGGRCTANRWTALQPPLMRPDHVHFTSAGGREIARRLQADLDTAARRVRAAGDGDD